MDMDTSLARYDWHRLTSLQLSKYAEHLFKMEFILLGCDVFTAEVDDHGLDFVVRKDETTYYDVQVKSVNKARYIFFPKSEFSLRANLLAAVVLFFNREVPKLYLMPATAWLHPNALLVSHDYIGKKGPPEWGLNLSLKNLPLLAEFAFDKTIQGLGLSR